MTANKDFKQFGKDFILAGTAAGISKTVVAPIERVKLLLQNQQELIRQNRLESKFKGIVDCFKRLYAEEGFASLWKGNLVNLIRYFPHQGILLATRDLIKKRNPFPERTSFYNPAQQIPWRYFYHFTVGCASALVALIAVYPMDYARTRLANDIKLEKLGGQRQFTGILDVFRKTIFYEGLNGIYRGVVVSSVGLVFYRGISLGIYDTVKPLLKPENDFFTNFSIGWGATIFAALLTYPLDTIPRRMMMTAAAKSLKYHGAYDCYVNIKALEGRAALWRGFVANILRAMSGAGALAGYDHLQYKIVGKKSGVTSV